MCKSGVYSIKCMASGKVYIGSSVDIPNRWRKHRWYLRQGKHPNLYLQSAWDKYGETCFEFTILESCQEDQTIEREQIWLDEVRSYEHDIGFNLSRLASGGYQGKVYIVTFPDGHEETVLSLNAFCRKHGLNVGNMCQCAHGRARSCKGFSCRMVGQNKKEWESSQVKGYKQGRNSWVKWRITKPNGEVIDTDNLRQFCLPHGLHDSMMCQVASGKLDSYKGYKCERIQNGDNS